MPSTLSHIPEFKVKYNDVFSLRNLYIMMHELLLEEGWKGPDGDSDGADVETYYSENIYQKGAHRGGKEMWIFWRVSREPGGRPSAYFKETLDIDMHMVYMQNVEVVHQGKKLNVQKGEIEFFFRPKLLGDIEGKWHDHRFLKHFQHIFEERIMRKEVEKMEKELWRYAYRIQAKIKQYLELRQYGPVPGEPFFKGRMGFEQVR